MLRGGMRLYTHQSLELRPEVSTLSARSVLLIRPQLQALHRDPCIQPRGRHGLSGRLECPCWECELTVLAAVLPVAALFSLVRAGAQKTDEDKCIYTLHITYDNPVSHHVYGELSEGTVVTIVFVYSPVYPYVRGCAYTVVHSIARREYS